jgi:hypothetical protein
MDRKTMVIKKDKEIIFLNAIFFSIAFIEIITEFLTDKLPVYIIKPLLIPLLTFIYWKSSIIKDGYFIAALFFAFVANIFFISTDFVSILTGTIFFGFYRIIIIYLIIKKVKVKSFFPVFLGGIPFIIVFLYLTSLTMNELGDGLYIYIVQIILMSILGGLSVANYMLDDRRMNYWLLISCMLFTLIQFILVLKIYYLSIFIFQPLAMFLYVFAQYSLYKFMINSESLDNDTLPF